MVPFVFPIALCAEMWVYGPDCGMSSKGSPTPSLAGPQIKLPELEQPWRSQTRRAPSGMLVTPFNLLVDMAPFGVFLDLHQDLPR